MGRSLDVRIVLIKIAGVLVSSIIFGGGATYFFISTGFDYFGCPWIPSPILNILSILFSIFCLVVAILGGEYNSVSNLWEFANAFIRSLGKLWVPRLIFFLLGLSSFFICYGFLGSRVKKSFSKCSDWGANKVIIYKFTDGEELSAVSNAIYNELVSDISEGYGSRSPKVKVIEDPNFFSINQLNAKKKEIRETERNNCFEKGIKLFGYSGENGASELVKCRFDLRDYDLGERNFLQDTIEISHPSSVDLTSFYNRSAQMLSDFTKGVIDLGYGSRDVSYYNEALGHFRKSRSLFKLPPELDFEKKFLSNIYLFEGICFDRLELYDSAVVSFERAVEFDGNNQVAIENLVISYYNTKNFAEALSKLADVSCDHFDDRFERILFYAVEKISGEDQKFTQGKVRFIVESIQTNGYENLLSSSIPQRDIVTDYQKGVGSESAESPILATHPYKINMGTKLSELVLVPGGSYLMGSDLVSINSDCSPVHEVFVDSFYIGKFEVTQELWEFVTGKDAMWYIVTNELRDKPNDGWDSVKIGRTIYHRCDSCAMISLSYWDDENFLKKFKNRNILLVNGEGVRNVPIRLPTEAEWEFAARGGPFWEDGYMFSGGNELDSLGYFLGNRDGYETHYVGQFKPNQLGIFDMSGGAVEPCEDKYDPKFYSKQGSEINPVCRVGKNPVIRGGGTRSESEGCTVYCRTPLIKSDNGYRLGLRVVIGVKELRKAMAD